MGANIADVDNRKVFQLNCWNSSSTCMSLNGDMILCIRSIPNGSCVNAEGNNESQQVLPLANPFIAAYLLTVVITSVCSNGLVLFVLFSRKKKLRSFQICFVSICLSDILFSLLLHTMSISTALGHDPESIFSSSGCLYFGVLALFFGTFDMVIHCVVAILRYVNLCHPGKIDTVSRNATVSLLIGSAIYSTMWSIGPVFGWGKYETFEVGCTIAFGDRTLSGRTFISCAFIFVFFFPLAVTCVCYLNIILEAGRQRKILNQMGNISSVGSSRLAVEMKLARVASLIAGFYVIAWSPYSIVCLWEAYGNAESLPWGFKIAASLFCKSATASNPFIYLFMSKGFRRETVETVRRLFCAGFQRTSAATRFSISSQRTSSYRTSSSLSMRSFRHSNWKERRMSRRQQKPSHGHSSSDPDTPKDHRAVSSI